MTPLAPSQTPSTPKEALPATNGLSEDDFGPDMDAYTDELIVEDGKPVESTFAERLYRLLTDTLYTSWAGPGEGRSFIAQANVGWFHTFGEPSYVPDVMLCLDVAQIVPLRQRRGRSYFQWYYGKPPDVVIELVSDRRGGEDGSKMRAYERLGLPFYVIFDPDNLLESGVLRTYQRQGTRFTPIDPHWMADIGLGLTLWQGVYQGIEETWLRWCDQAGRVIPTGAERAQQAEDRAERLAAKLRELGVDPEA